MRLPGQPSSSTGESFFWGQSGCWRQFTRRRAPVAPLARCRGRDGSRTDSRLARAIRRCERPPGRRDHGPPLGGATRRFRDRESVGAGRSGRRRDESTRRHASHLGLHQRRRRARGVAAREGRRSERNLARRGDRFDDRLPRTGRIGPCNSSAPAAAPEYPGQSAGMGRPRGRGGQRVQSPPV